MFLLSCHNNKQNDFQNVVESPKSETVQEEKPADANNNRVTSLDGEWFETHYAVHRVILTPGKKVVSVELDFDDNVASRIDGSYSVSGDVITLKMNDGTRHVGKVIDENGDVYLDFTDCGFGWLVPVAPSERTNLSSKKTVDKYSWMDGNWSLSASINDPYVGTIKINTSLKINTANKTMVIIDEDHGEVECNGRYTIDEVDCTISCGRMHVRFDPNRKQFYEEYQGRRTYYRK